MAGVMMASAPVEEAPQELTPQQKAAITRAKNKALRELEETAKEVGE